MDTVTYPDDSVVRFVHESYIPLLVPFDAKPLADDFNVKWTPTLVTLGIDRREHHRTVGFLNPEAFIASSLLGIGKYHFDNDRYSEALTFFEKTAADYSLSDQWRVTGRISPARNIIGPRKSTRFRVDFSRSF